jgi:alkyl hydroperoxide reductase subunit AhpC
MNVTALFLALASICFSPLDQGAAVELRYTGALVKVDRDSDGQAVKRFSLYCLVEKSPSGGRDIAFWMDERGGGAWPWPERFGQITLGPKLQATNAVQLRLLQEHNGTNNSLRIPRPLFEFADKLQAGASWNNESTGFEVKKVTKIQDRECWQVDVSTNFGRKRTLWVQKDSPLVVELEERLFMGQGEEYSLRMKLESLETLDEAKLAKVKAPLAMLLKLQTDLARPENDQNPELTDAQLAKVTAVSEALEKGAEGTPFGRLASVVSRDVKAQQQRTGELAQLGKKFLGQPAPEFVLNLLEGKPVTPADRAGKITVLHFWEYQGEPLVEPYGQVGYLDFLNSRRKKLGVQVYGVAVDARFADKAQTLQAQRSVGKLKSFMNLGYPLVADDGDLIAQFGDPRRIGAKLPLWVVIGADGKVAHYSTGFFKINPDEGLRELDEVVVKLIQEAKKASDGK